MLVRKKKAASTPHAELEVRDGRLTILDSKRNLVLDSPLVDIANVTLETKTVQKVQENLSSGVPDVRFIDSRVGPSIDNARIEIQVGAKKVYLTQHFTSQIDASEWLSKVRRFLRDGGWTPSSERESA